MNRQTSNFKKTADTFASDIGNSISTAKDFVEEKVESVTELYESGQQKAESLIRDTRAAIKKNPLASVGVALFCGWVVGRLFRKNTEA